MCVSGSDSYALLFLLLYFSTIPSFSETGRRTARKFCMVTGSCCSFDHLHQTSPYTQPLKILTAKNCAKFGLFSTPSHIMRPQLFRQTNFPQTKKTFCQSTMLFYQMTPKSIHGFVDRCVYPRRDILIFSERLELVSGLISHLFLIPVYMHTCLGTCLMNWIRQALSLCVFVACKFLPWFSRRSTLCACKGLSGLNGL